MIRQITLKHSRISRVRLIFPGADTTAIAMKKHLLRRSLLLRSGFLFFFQRVLNQVFQIGKGFQRSGPPPEPGGAVNALKVPGSVFARFL